MSHLTTHNLSIGYSPEKVLISEIDLDLIPGKLVGLVGQNGVGKSTLIRTLCGLHPKLSGSIELDDQQIEAYTPKEMAKKISVVLTGRPEALNLSVIELIALGRFPYSGWLGTLRSEDKQMVEESMTQMEINYLATKKLFELSDGQLQKVMIARALAQDTDYIILDEPTSHLDLKNKIEVLELLKRIAGSGKGILISTHEIQLASGVCHEYWCVDFGKEMLTGAPADLIKNGDLHRYLHLPEHLKIPL
ncbi:MAG: ABC transporter ATP-binding protein [Cyclobacteriaceae bacterium]